MRGQGTNSLAAAPSRAAWRGRTALWLLLCLAGGCGQKGPLTLPASAGAAAGAASAPSSR